MRQLVGKRALITGAGSGLGKALALQFARQGWQVAATDLNFDAARATAAEIERAGGKATADVLDVSHEASFAEVVGRVRKEWGGLDLLVNNAGVATAGTVADSPIAQWQWVLDINLLGCVRGARAVIPLMAAQGGGHIVNVSSFAGIATPPALASYNVAKAGVVALSETLRYECAPQRIGVSVACPSFFQTNLLGSSKAAARDASMSTAPQMEKITQHLMQTSTVTADDVAADIFNAVRDDRFLVITHVDARRRYHLKRLAPELYFRLAQKVTASFLRK